MKFDKWNRGDPFWSTKNAAKSRVKQSFIDKFLSLKLIQADISDCSACHLCKIQSKIQTLTFIKSGIKYVLVAHNNFHFHLDQISFCSLFILFNDEKKPVP